MHDWRAPISGLFYDHEPGPATYASPDATVDGRVERKRQYVIRDSRLEAVLDTSVGIDDEVLQRELSARPDDKMKNIVATIQREQNAIIRNEDADILLIQGAAGSGKTSIALHRVAYMLYRFKTTLDARDVLIVSPNKVFVDYISKVLPELGEETIPGIEFEQIARTILGPTLRFEGLHDQIERLLTLSDTAMRRRIREKSSVAFYEELRDHLQGLDRTHFQPADVSASTVRISADEIAARMHQYGELGTMTVKQRVAKLTASVLAPLKQRAASERVPWQSAWTSHVTLCQGDDTGHLRNSLLQGLPHRAGHSRSGAHASRPRL